MFYDFGLVHFHLGTKLSEKNPLLIEGTKEIVYALLNNNSPYAKAKSVIKFEHGTGRVIRYIQRLSAIQHTPNNCDRVI